MAFQTGTASSAANLLTIIQTFATDNGFTVASNVISDATGNSHTRITNVTLRSENTYLKLEGATNSGFTTNVTTKYCYLYAPAANWPVNYYLFYMASPKTIYCVITYGAGYTSWLMFGTVSKSTTLYTGGGFYSAQLSHAVGTSADPITCSCSSTKGGAQIGTSVRSSGMPFWYDDVTTSTAYELQNSYLHAEVDSIIWSGHNGGVAGTVTNVHCNQLLYPMLRRQPNTWNNHMVLFPVRLLYAAASSYYMDLGELTGLRVCKIDAYNNAEIITIGANKFMVFSARLKDSNNPLGKETSSNSVGTFGFAIAYDGP